MTETNLPLWPNSRFTLIGPLDYVVLQFNVDWLRHIAAILDSKGDLGDLSPHRWNVARCLSSLADAPAALKELNRYADRAPPSVRGLNVAVHCLAVEELHGRHAGSRVSKAWNVSAATVKDYLKVHRKVARHELEQLIRLRSEREASRRELLTALDADMRYRATLPWMQARKTPRKTKKYSQSRK